MVRSVYSNHESNLEKEPGELVFNDVDAWKDNFNKLLDNELITNDLGAKHKITRMEIQRDGRS